MIFLIVVVFMLEDGKVDGKSCDWELSRLGSRVWR